MTAGWFQPRRADVSSMLPCAFLVLWSVRLQGPSGTVNAALRP
jgi:hypothetical protein